MLVDAQRKFAHRIAKWMNESKLTAEEIEHRVQQFPDPFIRLIVEEHKELVKKKRPR